MRNILLFISTVVAISTWWLCGDLSCFSVMLIWVSTAGAILYWTNESRMLSRNNKAVLITGCDSGFGHDMAQYLDERGVKVYAGCLFSNGKGAQELRERCSGRLTVLQLDVTSEQQVNQAVAQVTGNGQGLWGVVNNAGIDFTSEIEVTPMEAFSHVAEVNLFGLIRVTKACLPLIRTARGRVVNVTSVKGVLPEPYTGAYCVTKFGAEAFSDILRVEMKKWGVKVCILEPGQYDNATNITKNPQWAKNFDMVWESMSEDLRSTYGKEFVYYILEQNKGSTVPGAADSTPVMKAAMHCLFAEIPHYRYLVDGHSGTFYDKHCVGARLRQWLPTYIIDLYLEKFFIGDHVLPRKLSLLNS